MRALALNTRLRSHISQLHADGDRAPAREAAVKPVIPAELRIPFEPAQQYGLAVEHRGKSGSSGANPFTSVPWTAVGGTRDFTGVDPGARTVGTGTDTGPAAHRAVRARFPPPASSVPVSAARSDDNLRETVTPTAGNPAKCRDGDSNPPLRFRAHRIPIMEATLAGQAPSTGSGERMEAQPPSLAAAARRSAGTAP
jgi:hypothetical protein